MTRSCAVCGASLEGQRSHARFCSGACRAEASRLRRIIAGEGADGYGSVLERERRRKRTQAPRRAL